MIKQENRKVDGRIISKQVEFNLERMEQIKTKAGEIICKHCGRKMNNHIPNDHGDGALRCKSHDRITRTTFEE